MRKIHKAKHYSERCLMEVRFFEIIIYVAFSKFGNFFRGESPSLRTIDVPS